MNRIFSLSDADPAQLQQILVNHLSAASAAAANTKANELLTQHMLLNPQQQLEMMNMLAASRVGLAKPTVSMLAGPLKAQQKPPQQQQLHSLSPVSSGQHQQQLSNFQALIAVNMLRNNFQLTSLAPPTTPCAPFNFNINLNSSLVTLANHHQHNVTTTSTGGGSSSGQFVKPAAGAKCCSSKRLDYSKLAQECTSAKNENRKSFAAGTDHLNASASELKSSKKTSKR